MELKQFITQTLNDIIDGIANSQEYARGKKALINPSTITTPTGKSFQASRNEGGTYAIQKIEFDLAITVLDEDKSKSGIGVISAVLNVGVQGEANLVRSEVSRVSFSVPIIFPVEVADLDL